MKTINTPIKAMRKKCLDCTAGSLKEVRLCPVVECALYPYRFGKRPTQAIVDTMVSLLGTYRQKKVLEQWI